MKERFHIQNGPLVYQLQVKIFNLTQGEDSVCSYHTKLTKLWNDYDMNRKSVEVKQEERLIKFINRLNGCYKQVGRQIILTELQYDLNKAYSMVTQNEQQRDLETPRESATALLAQAPYRLPKPQGERAYCDGCKRSGHTINTCYQLHGYLTERPTYQQGPIKTTHSINDLTIQPTEEIFQTSQPASKGAKFPKF